MQRTDFINLDRITEIELGKRLVGIRKLEANERYLDDHFPKFPVMPGVLMMESLFQAGAWLLRASCNFEEVVVELVEAKNVKFQDFVAPGMELTVSAEIVKQVENRFTLKLKGTVGDKTAMSGRMVVDRIRYADRYPDQSFVDFTARKEYMETFAELTSSIPTT